MPITATGLGSGLDINSLVSQLVAAERSTADSRLFRTEAVALAKLSAFGSLKGALSTLQGALSGLKDADTFQARKSSVSDEDVLAISAGVDASVGSYDIEVSQLAKANSLASGTYNTTADVVGEGEITFRFGTTVYDSGTDTYTSFTENTDTTEAKITIDSTNSSLEGIRDAINDADIGVNATIVNDGSGYRLLFSSTETGADNSLEVTVTESGPVGLSQFEFNATNTNLTQTVAAQDALLTINGLLVTSASNSVDEAIEGVELKLLSTTSGTPVNVDVSRNNASVKSQINKFISAYNSYIATVNDLTSFNADTLERGVLVGDNTLRSISGRLRGELNASIGGSASLQVLADIGVTTNANGTLKLDGSILDDILSENADQLAGLFSALATATDVDISFDSSTDKTLTGIYAVSVTTLATQAEYQGATGLALTIDSSNNTLEIKIDDVQSGEITFTSATYASGDDLAAEIETQINADSVLKEAGVSVVVSYDSINDRLVINTSSYGSLSTVEITQVDTDTTADLGLSVGSGTDGIDVAGTIGGVTATGAGQLLTGAAGSDAEGLALKIIGGLLGSRGSVNFDRGLAENLDNLLELYLGTDNLLDLRTEGLENQIDDVADQRERLNIRMESVEARLKRQFNGLDALLGQLKQTSDFLTQALANLPGPLIRNKR